MFVTAPIDGAAVLLSERDGNRRNLPKRSRKSPSRGAARARTSARRERIHVSAPQAVNQSFASASISRVVTT